jgi:serpin B
MEEARPSKKARGAAGSSLTAFGLRLAKHLAEGAGGGENQNLVFSPVSVYAALSLLAAGARGTTLNELLALLGATSRDELAEFARVVAERALADRSGSGAPLVAFACGLWHEKTVALKPAYRAAAVESYQAETRAADFSNKVSSFSRRHMYRINASVVYNHQIVNLIPTTS